MSYKTTIKYKVEITVKFGRYLRIVQTNGKVIKKANSNCTSSIFINFHMRFVNFKFDLHFVCYSKNNEHDNYS